MKWFLSRVPAPISLLTGVILLGISGALVYEHVRSVIMVRDVSVPLMVAVPELEHRSALLKEQVELAELQASLRIGSYEEQVHRYVLPEHVDFDRLIALFDVLSLLTEEHTFLASMSPLTVGDEMQSDDGLQSVPLFVSFAVHEDGMDHLINFFRLAGLVTVADALSPAEIAVLLERLETENPAGIVALEQFFSAGLLQYSREPRPYEESLRRTFVGSSVLPLLEEALQTSLLADAKQFLGGHLGQVLEQQQLWPLPFLLVHDVVITPGRAPGWYMCSLTLQHFARGSST